MTPKYHCFQNYSRLYGVPGLPSEEEENALANAAFEAFRGSREIEIRPAGTMVDIAMIWRRAPHYEDTMKEQCEDFMRRITSLPYQVISLGKRITRDPYGMPGTPVRVCVMFMTMEYRKL